MIPGITPLVSCLLGIVLVAFSVTNAALAQVDTVRACVGAPVQLNGPAGFATYTWISGAGALGRQTQSVRVSVQDTTQYVVESRESAGAELVVNGGFEDGNQAFTSDYRYAPGGSILQGTYAVMRRPSSFNSAFADCMDQTAVDGLMYIADGSTVNGDRAWCQRITTVTPGVEYAFSARATSLVTANPPRLAFSIDGQQLSPTIAPGNVPCDWEGFFSIWRAPAGVTTVELCIENINTAPNGNDFALDAVSFIELGATRLDTFIVVPQLAVRDSLSVGLCPGQRYTDNGLNLGPDERGIAILTTTTGCDSILTVQTRSSDTTFTSLRADTLCPGEILQYSNFTISSDTVLCEFLQTIDGCDSVACITVKYLNESAVGAVARDPSCTGDRDGSLSVQVSAGRPPYTYRWDNGETNPLRTDLAAGTYSVTVNDSRGCQTQQSFTLTDPESLRILQAFPFDVRCAGESNGGVVLTGLGGTGPLQTVAISGGNVFASDALRAGAYEVRLIDSLGCSTTLDSIITITSPSPVTVFLRGPVEVRLGAEATHQATASGDSVQVSWFFDTLALNAQVVNDRLQWQPTQAGELIVIATDENGCTDRAALTIDVELPEFEFFPNAFSPNQDGSNDVFAPLDDPAIVAVREFSVFDRWGNWLFGIRDCLPGVSGSCGWDGTTRGGEALEAGVYVYTARIELVNGQELNLVGDVMLVGRRP